MTASDVLAMDGLAVIGTLGFLVPAVILVVVVVGAVVRDRRLAAQEEAEEAADVARAHEAPDHEHVQGRRPDRPGTPPTD